MLEEDYRRAAFLAAASKSDAIASLGLWCRSWVGVERCSDDLRLRRREVIRPGSGCGFWPVGALRRDGRNRPRAQIGCHFAGAVMAAIAATARGQAVRRVDGKQRRGEREAEEEYHCDGQVSPHAVYEHTRKNGERATRPRLSRSRQWKLSSQLEPRKVN